MGNSPLLAQAKLEQEHAAPSILPAEQAWLVTLDASPLAGGVMDEAHVYIPLGARQGGAVPDGTDRLVALDRHSGELRWARPLSSRWAPAVAQGRVFVAAADGIHALDAQTGDLIWHAPLTGRIAAAPAVAGPLLLALNSEGLVALRAGDGQPAWQQALDTGDDPAAMLMAGDALFLSLNGARVVRIALEDGRRVWERTLSGTLGPPAVARDRVLVGSTDNHLYALDPENGRFEWRYPAGADVVGAAAAGDTIFFVALDNVLRALARGSGNQRWKARLGTRPSAPPRVLAGAVVVSGFSPALSAFDADTGTALGTYTAPSDLTGPALVDPDLQPFRVAMVAITGDGRVAGLIPAAMMFREPPPVPLTGLPGRGLTPDAASGPAPSP